MVRDAKPVTLHAHCIRPSTDLIDFAWGDPEMHCGSVRSIGSVSCVQKLRTFLLFRLWRIRQPIRLRYVGKFHWRCVPPSVRHSSCRPLTDGYVSGVTGTFWWMGYYSRGRILDAMTWLQRVVTLPKEHCSLNVVKLQTGLWILAQKDSRISRFTPSYLGKKWNLTD